MTIFTGIIPPVSLPLDDAGELDRVGLERLTAGLLDAGVHGVFPLGSTGEAIYLADATRRRVLDIVTGVVGEQVPVFAGALDGSTARVLDQLPIAVRSGVTAIVVTAPFYANVGPAETVRHFETIAAASELPVLAYDIPGNVGRKLPAEVTVELLSRGVVAGLKDSSGDFDVFVDIIDRVGAVDGVSILTGSDTRALESLQAGASGIVPGIGNVCADLFVQLWDAFAIGDLVAAQQAQDRITAMTAVFGIGLGHGLAKHASELGGIKAVLQADGVIESRKLSAPLSDYPDEAAADAIAAARAARA